MVEEYRNPTYATAVGLVLEGADREAFRPSDRGDSRSRERSQSSFVSKLTEWLKKEFF